MSVARGVNWSPPPRNGFKLNYDAATFKDINSLGFDALIRNEIGEVMAAMAARRRPVSDNKEAEVLACPKLWSHFGFRFCGANHRG